MTVLFLRLTVFLLFSVMAVGCQKQEAPVAIPPNLPHDVTREFLASHFSVSEFREAYPHETLAVKILSHTIPIARFWDIAPENDEKAMQLGIDLDRAVRAESVEIPIYIDEAESETLTENRVEFSLVDGVSHPVETVTVQLSFSNPVENPFRNGLGKVGVFVIAEIFAPDEGGSRVFAHDTYWVSITRSGEIGKFVKISSGLH